MSRYKSVEGMQYSSWKLQHWDCDLQRETLACQHLLNSGKSLRPQPGGGVLITDGPYLETKEHNGGFWILECADMDEAVAWARKGVAATRGQVEVREIFFNPSPDEQLSGGLAHLLSPHDPAMVAPPSALFGGWALGLGLPHWFRRCLRSLHFNSTLCRSSSRTGPASPKIFARTAPLFGSPFRPRFTGLACVSRIFFRYAEPVTSNPLLPRTQGWGNHGFRLYPKVGQSPLKERPSGAKAYLVFGLGRH